MVRVALELVPTPVGMLGGNIPQGTAGYARDGVFECHPFFIAWEWFAEQGPGGKTWAYSSCGSGLGFWVERDRGYGPCYWVRIQGPNGSGYHGAVQ